MKIAVVYFSLVSLLLYGLTDGTLAPKSKSSKTKKKNSNSGPTLNELQGPQKLSVIEKQLVRPGMKMDDIIVHRNAYNEETGRRHFNGTILGYVTPWNNHGYDVAKIWAPKFSYISPVWLRIKRVGREKYEFAGTHDIDHAWMKSVKQNSAPTKLKIVPRVLFENWSANDFSQLFTGPKEERAALVKECKKLSKQWKLDGFVFELLSQLPAQRVGNELIIDLIKYIGLSMAESLLDVILVLPPSRGQPYDEDTIKLFGAVHPYISAFSLMTYDFSNPQRPGPNAPFEWIRRCVLNLVPDDDDQEARGKILMGLNFYGNAYSPTGGGPIVGNEFIEILKNAKGVMKFDDKNIEHFIDVKTPSGRKLVFFPTLYSIQRRIDLAAELGTGISIWELGQGLDYFYDLL